MDMEQLYQERLRRYVTAMRNEKPDCVPIRPFAAEFCARYAGYTAQQVTHDYEQAFAAVRKTAADFDWDAVVGNMVYVWTGLTQAMGMKYYAVPGIDIPENTGFQYREPSEEDAFMRADEYDALIADPTGFLYDVWLPRVSTEIAAPGTPNTRRNNLSLVKGGMAMLSYFNAFGDQAARLRSESGTVSAIAGILKAPFDILADKLRGYVGLTMDMWERPEKVLKACEALMPHLLQVALTSSDPTGTVPIGFWMHRGCVPFVTAQQFDSHYWPTLKPIIEELWANGRQTLFYAEGNWNPHLERFAELPDRSIVYHVDRGDIFKAHRKIGHKFCLSGGVPNTLLSVGKPADVRAWVKEVIEGVAGDGGYILDASAIIQNDATVENMRAFTEAGREYGVYSSGSLGTTTPPAADAPPLPRGGRMPAPAGPQAQPGVTIPWEDEVRVLPPIKGDADLVRRIWEQVDAFGHMYIWQCLLSF